MSVQERAEVIRNLHTLLERHEVLTKPVQRALAFIEVEASSSALLYVQRLLQEVFHALAHQGERVPHG